MTIPAYDKIYLDSMMQKHRYLFRLIGRNFDDAFSIIETYMNSDYRRYMDMGNPLYLNKTPKQILGSLDLSFDIHAEISWNYDEFILDWMSDIYNYFQWKYAIPSSKIVSHIPPEQLYRMYHPLHEASLDNGVEKLMKIGHLNDTAEK